MNTAIDTARIRRENLRWLILLTLNNARPIGAFEGPILSVAQSEYPDATPLELRRELDYLQADEIGEDGEKIDPGERVALLSKAAKNIATLTRSSINLKEFQAKVEEATRKRLHAEQEANLQEVAKAQGMDEAQVDFWRRKFLGIGK